MKLRKSRSSLSDKDIVIYALYLLGGWQKRVHTEDIAIKCFELAPNRFSWIKYPQFPDLAPARFALEAAKKQKNGNLVEGESERKKDRKGIGGWRLTGSGLSWVEINKKRIELSLEKKDIAGERLLSDRRLKELMNSKAFKKFIDMGENATINMPEFTESLICTINTTKDILRERIEQLEVVARKQNILSVVKYLHYCKKLFNI